MKHIKYLFILLFFVGCSSSSYRLPSSTNNEGQTADTIKCAVKCAIGPVKNSYFHVKSIKVKYIDVNQIAPDGVVSQEDISTLDNYCKKYSENISAKKKTSLHYLAVSSRAPIYHGQILKQKSSGFIEIPNHAAFGLNVATACQIANPD